jgi:hypothetical protein
MSSLNGGMVIVYNRKHKSSGVLERIGVISIVCSPLPLPPPPPSDQQVQFSYLNILET